jgi:ABC-2 type transport system ATP-binding protein
MQDIITVTNLYKRFANFTAVDDISFSLREGEILGFLGPNGAGKTTTIQMLLGVLLPTSGLIQYFGQELQKNRQAILEQVNFSSTYTNLPWSLTVRESLTFISYLYKISDRQKRIDEIVSIFKLQDLQHSKVDSLSAGQLTRLNLAKALINFPKVLLLDEPTASLDPDVADYIRQFLLTERKQFNVSILITSHNMAEVEELCDRVVFINHGKVIANDTPTNLSKTMDVCHVELLVPDQSKLMAYCRTHSLQYVVRGKYIVVDVSEKKLADFLHDLTSSGVMYEEISIEKPSLEDYFLKMSK